MDAQPDGCANGLSTGKYVAIAQVSRATAYRQSSVLVALCLLVRSGQGRDMRYALADLARGG